MRMVLLAVGTVALMVTTASPAAASSLLLPCYSVYPAVFGTTSPKVGFQTGVGIQASISVKKRRRHRRINRRLSWFTEVTAVCVWDARLRPIVGVELASRRIAGSENRLELLARGGGGVVTGWGGYHINLASAQAVFGVSVGRMSGVGPIGGVGLRGPGVIARAMFTPAQFEGGAVFIDVGLELGLSPPIYLVEH